MSKYFHECHWGQCLELLVHLCNYSDSIILVTGPAGIGKTTMLRALREQEAEQFVFCDLQGTPGLTSEQLTDRIELDLDLVNEKDLLLLIDDAQYLGLDVISMIFQLKQRTVAEGRLHIALFATDEFEQKITRSVLKEEFSEQVHAVKIEPLTLLEMESFLRHHWGLKHRENDIPFDRAKCKKIHALSGGIPGKILEVIEKMDSKADKEPGQQSLSPFTVGMTVSFGILFCILAILWPSADKTILTKNETTVTEQPLQIAKNEITHEISHEIAEVPSEIKMVEVTTTVDTLPETEAVVAQANTTPITTVAEASAITTMPESYDEKIARLENKVNELQRQVATEQKALRATESKLQQLLAKQQPESTKKTAKKSTLKTLSKSRQEKEILALPSKNYTLQLLSMTDEDKVKKFVNDHNLLHKANYYKTNIKGNDWFVLVYGNYSNKYDAQLAMARLPNALKKLQPKTREYSDIQQAINNRGK